MGILLNGGDQTVNSPHIYVCTYSRPDTISTPSILEDLDYTVVVHSDEWYDKYKAAGVVPADRMVVSGVQSGTYGKANQHNWVLDNLVDAGDWIMFMNDNITGFQAVPYPLHSEESFDFSTSSIPGNEWRRTYRTVVDMRTLMRIVDDLIVHAEEVGAWYCGFSVYENYYFRPKKWQERKLIVGNCVIMRKCTLRYNCLTDDTWMTSLQLLKRGTTLHDKFTFVNQKHYTAGGIGAYEERVPVLLREAKFMYDLFDGLHEYYMKQGGIPGGYIPKTYLKFRLHTAKQIANWRESMRTPVVCSRRYPV